MTRSPFIIGHRGASSHAPENTLAAFQMALDEGADGVEFDVQLAKDGVPVVIHDIDLKRTGLRKERIADLSSNELGKIDTGSWFNNRYPQKAKSEFVDETIPTLASVLQLLNSSGGPIYIELKCDEATYRPLVAAVSEVIRDSPMLPRMIVKSFKLAVIPEMRRLVPDVQTAALFEPSMVTVLRRRNHIITMAREFGAHQISVHYSLITQKFAALATEAEMPVTIWTIEDPKWVERSRRLRIGAVITNDPAKLIAARF